MYLTTAPPLLFALGVRIFLNFMNPGHADSAPDFILHGLWQGVLLYYVLKHHPWATLPIGFAISAKLVFDFTSNFDTVRCACTLLGTALGVLFTDVLAQLFEQGRYNDVEPATPKSAVPQGQPREPSSRRLRLVSFERSSDPERPSHRHKPSADRTRAAAPSPAPTNEHSIDTALTLDSLPSSIDPHGQLSPLERDVTLLRARASLADSERRRFKEERKWALSQGNHARAEQLAWQVRRYTTLMESFHREADAKVVEAARATAQPIPVPQPVPVQQAPRHSQINYTQPHFQSAQQSQTIPSNGTPLVSVTLGGGRHRKKSGGASILKPSIHVHTR
ncbi:hypothetical protein PHLGIDRAFT_129662 [Phlebiopsis gigantea 11061_1 CR5-6]|uniref:Uncharacterized protein n=1 Tax=Phlebiopsis gigantea (strain 11061_1 CR5-6) TaxID=745531 RepID=A0A0C3PF89_PHLG1|nr:hypothetical protein PHLGIDRAFT_129662 [Phlebiopsis gigantea 11061_1 CR5-6]